MTNLNRRIDTIEKRLSLGQHKEPRQRTIIMCLQSMNEPTVDPESLGPNETWLTYQEQLQAGKKANDELLKENPSALPGIIYIVLDADKELQARKAKEDNERIRKTN